MFLPSVLRFYILSHFRNDSTTIDITVGELERTFRNIRWMTDTLSSALVLRASHAPRVSGKVMATILKQFMSRFLFTSVRFKMFFSLNDVYVNEA